MGEDGLPWHDDLYLDVIAEPEPGGWGVSATNIIDAEELEEAVQAGLVTAELAEATWTQARAVAAELHAGSYAPLGVLRRYLEDPYT